MSKLVTMLQDVYPYGCLGDIVTLAEDEVKKLEAIAKARKQKLYEDYQTAVSEVADAKAKAEADKQAKADADVKKAQEAQAVKEAKAQADADVKKAQEAQAVKEAKAQADAAAK